MKTESTGYVLAVSMSEVDLEGRYPVSAGLHPEKMDDEIYLGYASSSSWPQSRSGIPETCTGMAEGDPPLTMYPIFVKRAFFEELMEDHFESMLRWQRVLDVGSYTISERWKAHCNRKTERLIKQRDDAAATLKENHAR
jgi:hypothetical protein